MIAVLEIAAGDQGKAHLDAIDDVAGSVPIFCFFRHYPDEAHIGIIRAAPPEFWRNRPQLRHFFAIRDDLGGPGYRDVFLSARIAEREADLRIVPDFLVFVRPHVSEEVNHAFIASDEGTHRPRTQSRARPRREHAEPNGFHQFPCTIDVRFNHDHHACSRGMEGTRGVLARALAAGHRESSGLYTATEAGGTDGALGVFLCGAGL